MIKNKKRIIIACIWLAAIILLGIIINYTFIHKYTLQGCPLTAYEMATGKILPECMLINDSYVHQPSFIEPIIALDTTLDLGKKKTLKIGFYCKNQIGCDNAKPEITYVAGYVKNDVLLFNQSDLDKSGLTFTSTMSDVKSNEYTVFEPTISSSESMPAGGYIVAIQVDDYENPGQEWAQKKQIVLTIR